MIKPARILMTLSISAAIMISGCTAFKKEPSDNSGGTVSSQKNIGTTTSANMTVVSAPSPSPAVIAAPIDLSQIKPDESGKIMVVMFHNFVESFTPSAQDDGQYTTTFDEFRKLLDTLYNKGYRLVNLNDYLNSSIDVAAGYVPLIFTFDDGSVGQFSLIEKNGKLEVNPESAVGVMEDFNRIHPDFGLKGSFYVNLGLNVFGGDGTVAQRLQYLIDKGFEIGNHTYTHINMTQVTSADKLKTEVGRNQARMLELVNGYMMRSLALPFGAAPENLRDFVAKGEYNGVSYENFAILEVGAGPTLSPVNKSSTPLSMSRVRASGIKKVDCDLDWWLQRISRADEYVSDGNTETFTVPKSKEAVVDKLRLKGKTLVTY